MHEYRDLKEYHDKCHYCLCAKCKTDNCRLVSCEFCEGGVGNAKEKCNKKCCTASKAEVN